MSETSKRAKVLAEIVNRFYGDHLIGRKLKTGELRKTKKEPEWRVPKLFEFEHIEMFDFTMKLLTRKENPQTDRAILLLHGGGYMVPVRNNYYKMAGVLNEVSGGLPVLVPDYRVAPENSYPAALDDALSAYDWLLKKGFKGEQIILAGDSAGGGLAFALTMYLRDHLLPIPGGIIAMSPWTDLTASGESYESNYLIDPIFGNTKESMIYQNDYPGFRDKTHPYISPVFGSFHDFPPMLIQVGEREMLLSDSVNVVAKAKEQGVSVRLSIYPGMFHVFQFAFHRLPESKRAWEEIRHFINII